MKKFYYLSLLLGLVFGSLTFVACGDDDDDPSPSPTPDVPSPSPATETEIAGTWKFNLSENVQTWEGKKVKTTLNYTLSFNNDGSFVCDEIWDKQGNGVSGTWTKLGNDKVVVDLTAGYNLDSLGNKTPASYFKARKDTMDYFFKKNVLFCQAGDEGYLVFTRNGELPFSGFGNYANSPVVGIWQGADFAWDKTPIDILYDFRSDGSFVMTMDNNLGWSEGFAGYYVLDGSRFMLIRYFFISKMGEATNTWQIQGFSVKGGVWSDFQVKDNKLYSKGFFNMSGEMNELILKSSLKATLVGHWTNTDSLESDVVEDEYWEIESNKTVRHWWIRDGQFTEGTMGTYELGKIEDESYNVERDCMNIRWTHWLKDSGDNKNPSKGNEMTGRDDVDYVVKYLYSPVVDRLYTWWPNSEEAEGFIRIK